MAWQVLAVQKRAEITPGAGQGAGETLQKGKDSTNPNENIAHQPELYKIPSTRNMKQKVHHQKQLSLDILQA